MRSLLFFIVLSTVCWSCNKNSNQLPPVKTNPGELVKTVSINGSQQIDVIFRQTTIKGHDTVYISVRNLTVQAIDSITLVIELCNAVKQDYENCNLQFTLPLGGIAVEDIKENVLQLVDKKLVLKDSLINIRIITLKSASAEVEHQLSGLYSGGIVRFIDTIFNVTDSIVTDSAGNKVGTVPIISRSARIQYYGDIKGYIAADGAYTFRLKAAGPVYYNMYGYFVDTFAMTDGRIEMDGVLATPLQLAAPPPMLPHIRLLADGKLSFSLYLEAPLEKGSIDSISVNTQKR